MYERDVSLTGAVSAELVEQGVERACREMGLHIGMRDTLARYPGSIHWHVKRGSGRGTLEITFAPGPNRLWLAVHAGRKADWIDEALTTLPARIARHVEGVAPSFAVEPEER